LRRALAARLQVSRPVDRVEVDFVLDVLVEIRDVDPQAARARILEPDVVTAARFLFQNDVGGGRRRGAAVERDLVKARRPEAGAVARAVFHRRDDREILHIRGAQPDARMRAELLVVVVARARGHEERFAELALVLEVVALLIPLARRRVYDLLGLKIDAVGERHRIRVAIAPDTLEPAQATVSAER